MEIVKSLLKPKDKNGNEAVDLPQMMLELQRFHEQEFPISPGAYQLMVTLFLAFNEHLRRTGTKNEKTIWGKSVLQLTNDQLLNRLKWKSEKSLINNRKELVQAGILLYEPGKAKSKGSLYKIRFIDTDVTYFKYYEQENRPLYKNGRVSSTVKNTVVSTVKNTPINGLTTVKNSTENPLTTVKNTVVSTVKNTPITTVKSTPPYIDSLHKNEPYLIEENKDIIRELKKKENVLENRTRDLQPKNKEFQLKYVGTVSTVKLSEYPIGEVFYLSHNKCVEGYQEIVMVDDTIKDGQITCSLVNDKTAILLTADTKVFYRDTEEHKLRRREFWIKSIQDFEKQNNL